MFEDPKERLFTQLLLGALDSEMSECLGQTFGTRGILTHAQPICSGASQRSIGWSGAVFASALEGSQATHPETEHCHKQATNTQQRLWDVTRLMPRI
tara:strand:- start:190 stop:480 length:291 start_codon:yes stop_codon:yes gene_type:complete